MGREKDRMYAWKLRSERIPPPPEEGLLELERIVGEDRREKVSPEEFRKGGKLSAVLKIVSWVNGVKSKGTGWLIRDDLAVTAAHVVVDLRGGTCGFATRVQATTGYTGMDTTESEHTEYREGIKVVVPRDFVSSRQALKDFAFVQLNKSFNNVTPFKPLRTPPVIDSRKVCIVGYPGDRSKTCRTGCEEIGAEMYTECGQINCVLEDNGGLLAYHISTFAGNSGSPVLYEDDDGTFSVIGTHGGFSHSYMLNQASPILEDSVNSYWSIIDRFFSGAWPRPYKKLRVRPCRVSLEAHYLYPLRLIRA